MDERTEKEEYSIPFGQSKWKSLLSYVWGLHLESRHPPFHLLPYQWEEVAPGQGLPATFGHLDHVHMIFDSIVMDSRFAAQQIENLLVFQQEDGFMPGSCQIVDFELRWSRSSTFPPLWPWLVDKSGIEIFGLDSVYQTLIKQIGWFENERKACDQGFYYLDALDRIWESGVVEGVRYDAGISDGNAGVSIDATCHVYSLFDFAVKWARQLGRESGEWEEKRGKLGEFIQNELFDDEKGFFFDSWSIQNKKRQRISFEGLWPLVVGAATPAQAQRLINEWVMQPDHFYTNHPIPTVAISDPSYENRYWRGPTRNSMVLWVAEGCRRYGRADAASLLLEKALDQTAYWHAEHGTIWEFYDPEGKDPQLLNRHQPGHPPFRNYLGQNPLLAMAKIWEDSLLVEK